MRRILTTGGLLAVAATLSLQAMDKAPLRPTTSPPKSKLEVDKGFVGLVQSRVVARTGGHPDHLGEIIDTVVFYEAGKPKTFKVSRSNGETLEVTITSNFVESVEN